MKRLSMAALVFAHRGASKVAPENTLPAFEAAVRMGADGVELDVQHSSDGALVIFHNPRLNATTNGEGRHLAHAGRATRAGRRQLVRPAVWGTRIATLDEVLDPLKDKLLVNIEIKAALDSATMGWARMSLRPCKYTTWWTRWSSARSTRWRCGQAEECRPEIEAGSLLALDPPGWTRWAFTRNYSKTNGLHPNRHGGWPGGGNTLRGSGCPCASAWTVNEPEDMQRMIDLGVDAIITDYPDRLIELLK